MTYAATQSEEVPFIMPTEQAQRTVKNYMWLTMAGGLIPVPILDLAAISGLQLKMLADLCRIYNVPFRKESGKSIIAALLGYIVPESLSRGAGGFLLKIIPIIGPITGALSMSIFAGASTYAIGNIFIHHLASGGTLLDMDVEGMKEKFKEEFEKGKQAAKEMKEKGKGA